MRRKTGQREAKVCLKHLGDKPLDEITASDLITLRKKLEVGHKPATVSHYLSALHGAMSRARKQWDILASIPFFSYPKIVNKRFRVITPEEEKTVHAYFEGSRFPEMADLVTVLADTGMRLSEALTLRAEDINLATGMIHVSEDKSFLPRSVPISDRVAAILHKKEADPRVFRLTVNQAEWAWIVMRKTLDYGNDAQFTINAFRHTYSSRLVQAGINLYIVRSLLGFSTTEGTKHATPISPESMRTVLFVLNSQPTSFRGAAFSSSHR